MTETTNEEREQPSAFSHSQTKSRIFHPSAIMVEEDDDDEVLEPSVISIVPEKRQSLHKIHISTDMQDDDICNAVVAEG